jgi:hypothetical protein
LQINQQSDQETIVDWPAPIKRNILSSTCGGESILRINCNIILSRASSLRLLQQQAPSLNKIAQVKKIKVSLSLEDCN